jgi:hypothetical protein
MPDYDKNVIAAYLAQAGNANKSTTERGTALEELAVYLFEAIPGVIIGPRNQFDAYRCFEIDASLFNQGAFDGLAGFATDIRIECKSWASAVGSMEVAWFDSKLRATGSTCGVLFALNGITGDKWDLRHANKVVEMAVALPDARHILVITKDDLLTLNSSEELVQLLIDKRLRVSTARALPIV